jgi:restriction system protein
MTVVEFEQLLVQVFRARGLYVQTTKASGDQGADLIREKFGERTLVQAKRYSNRVSNSAVQEAAAAKALYRCYRAVVVTSNYFTEGAKQPGVANHMALWDWDKLTAALAQYL